MGVDVGWGDRDVDPRPAGVGRHDGALKRCTAVVPVPVVVLLGSGSSVPEHFSSAGYTTQAGPCYPGGGGVLLGMTNLPSGPNVTVDRHRSAKELAYFFATEPPSRGGCPGPNLPCVPSPSTAARDPDGSRGAGEFNSVGGTNAFYAPNAFDNVSLPVSHSGSCVTAPIHVGSF